MCYCIHYIAPDTLDKLNEKQEEQRQIQKIMEAQKQQEWMKKQKAQRRTQSIEAKQRDAIQKAQQMRRDWDRAVDLTAELALVEDKARKKMIERQLATLQGGSPLDLDDAKFHAEVAAMIDTKLMEQEEKQADAETIKQMALAPSPPTNQRHSGYKPKANAFCRSVAGNYVATAFFSNETVRWYLAGVNISKFRIAYGHNMKHLDEVDIMNHRTITTNYFQSWRIIEELLIAMGPAPSDNGEELPLSRLKYTYHYLKHFIILHSDEWYGIMDEGVGETDEAKNIYAWNCFKHWFFKSRLGPVICERADRERSGYKFSNYEAPRDSSVDRIDYAVPNEQQLFDALDELHELSKANRSFANTETACGGDSYAQKLAEYKSYKKNSNNNDINIRTNGNGVDQQFDGNNQELAGYMIKDTGNDDEKLARNDHFNDNNDNNYTNNGNQSQQQEDPDYSDSSDDDNEDEKEFVVDNSKTVNDYGTVDYSDSSDDDDNNGYVGDFKERNVSPTAEFEYVSKREEFGHGKPITADKEATKVDNNEICQDDKATARRHLQFRGKQVNLDESDNEWGVDMDLCRESSAAEFSVININ